MSQANFKITAFTAMASHAAEICDAVKQHLLENNPEIRERWTPQVETYCDEDCRFHLDYLGQAVDRGHPELFVEYVQWVQSVLLSYNVPAGDLLSHLRSLRYVIAKTVAPDELALNINAVIDLAADSLMEQTHAKGESFLQPVSLSALASAYLEAIMRQEREYAVELITAAVASGIPVKHIYLHVLQPVQQEIGRLWQTNQISVALEHYATSIAQLVLGQLYSATPRPQTGERFVAIAACVAREQHELGVRMVADFFHMDGWKAIFLGPDTPAAAVVATIKHHRPHVVALSATLTPHLQQLSDLITLARTAGVEHMKILVGGHPFSVAPELWRTVGADAYAKDAAAALDWANQTFPR